jgi:hypothetical protein
MLPVAEWSSAGDDTNRSEERRTSVQAHRKDSAAVGLDQARELVETSGRPAAVCAPEAWDLEPCMTSLVERHAAKIVGTLSCYDRVIIQGTLPGVGYAAGMTGYLKARGVRIFDFAEFTKPLTQAIRENVQRIASQHGLEVEYIRSAKLLRKEDRIAEVLAKRGNHPGLVHIFSAMETCSTFAPWHDKKTGKTSLRRDSGKCIHYYFYFLDPELGLCYVRVPTWAPFRLQVYFNGHNWLAHRLEERGSQFTLADNAFLSVDDFAAAQKLSDGFDVKPLHKALDRFAAAFCPVAREFRCSFQWSLMQVEYATGIVFKSKDDLKDVYPAIIRTALHAAKVDDVMGFLGRKHSAAYRGEIGTDLKTRIWGTRLKHRMGPSSIKIYDKFGCVLRIETTTNDVAFFKHHRQVVQKDGQIRFKLAPVRKTIYSLNPDLRQLLAAANQRYLAFISALDLPVAGIRDLNEISAPVRENGRPYRGFNLFHAADRPLFETLARGEFVISGLRNRDLRTHIPDSTTHPISRGLKRLRLHGIVKRVPGTFKYYLTDFGRRIVIGSLAIKEMTAIPAIARADAS